uniref:Uncharacterized protein n=1 Tax=Plectus sambesii TaxID=2011161 RepID=A0A914WT11_9BILA
MLVKQVFQEERRVYECIAYRWARIRIDKSGVVGRLSVVWPVREIGTTDASSRRAAPGAFRFSRRAHAGQRLLPLSAVLLPCTSGAHDEDRARQCPSKY